MLPFQQITVVMMIETIKERYRQLQSRNGNSAITLIEQNAFNAFNTLGIPTVRNEEWKYTRIGGLFNKEYVLAPEKKNVTLTASDLKAVRLPGFEMANELVFVNGSYSASLSVVRSSALVIQPLEEAARNEHKEIVSKHLGHSAKYVKDGIHALNTAFLQEGMFIHVKKGQILEHPVYIYNVVDARSANILAQPRTLIHLEENAQVKIVETYATIGMAESFTNQVMEIVVEKDAIIEYYKIQNDSSNSNQVSTTHFRQIGKSFVHALTISLNGGIIRNNLNMVLEAAYSEANLHGLYFVKGGSHIDNHTIVDNVLPNCQSNELYKGVIDDHATAVFNGKIYVQPQAQKTNAFQSNKNVLLSDAATVNTKPQLEIFADDVKCSHGCTVGQLDEESMFYLRSRGITKHVAKSLLVHAFAKDILNYIKLDPLREYVDQLISERLEI
jgi:Fe-S cluster assembly protein SufD